MTNEQKATISSKNWNIVIPQEGEVKTELEVTDANTLIATIDGRQFTKTNDGLAIACTVIFGSYAGILLVSEVEEAVILLLVVISQVQEVLLTMIKIIIIVVENILWAGIQLYQTIQN